MPSEGTDTRAEEWCADFVEWAYQKVGYSVSGTTARASSVRYHPPGNGTFHPYGDGYKPQPGDAVVWTRESGPDVGTGHVGLIVKVEADGDIWTVNGNSQGANDSTKAYQVYYKLNPNIGTVAKPKYTGAGTFQGFASPKG